MYARDFAVQSLLAAIISLVAPFQFGIGAQRVYAAQRILVGLIDSAGFNFDSQVNQLGHGQWQSFTLPLHTI
jgi:hypothetical protein